MDQFINVFKILSDETRLRIILLLSKEELCVCELCGILEVSQPTVSRNLGILREWNIVVDDRREKFVFYKLREENNLLSNILKLVSESIKENRKFILDLERLKNKEIYISRKEVFLEDGEILTDC